MPWYMTKVIISGLRCVNEGHEFLGKKHETPSMYWGITIFTNFEVRVCQQVEIYALYQKLQWFYFYVSWFVQQNSWFEHTKRWAVKNYK